MKYIITIISSTSAQIEPLLLLRSLAMCAYPWPPSTNSSLQDFNFSLFTILPLELGSPSTYLSLDLVLSSEFHSLPSSLCALSTLILRSWLSIRRFIETYTSLLLLILHSLPSLIYPKIFVISSSQIYMNVSYQHLSCSIFWRHTWVLY